MYGIVGGGVSGLAVAHYLRQRGAEAVVWEADDEPGGVVRSRRVDGAVLERGPQRVRATPGLHELADAAGVADDLLTAADPPLYAYRDGDVHRLPLSPGAAVGTDLLSWRSKARILLEPLTGGVREGETVRQFLRRSFGEEATTHCFGPLYGGIYASDPAEMPVEHSLAKALDHAGVDRSVLVAAARKLLAGRERPPMCSVEGGLQRLPEGLAATGDVRLSTPVTGIERREQGDGNGSHGRADASGGTGRADASGGTDRADASGSTDRADGAGTRWAVETPAGTTVVDELVVTTPAGPAADLLADVAPDAAGRLRRLAYNPLAVVHLRADWAFDGAGIKVPAVEGFATRGLTAHGPLFGREGVVTAFLGGGHAPDLVERSDDDLAALAAEEFATLTGATGKVLDVSRVVPGMPAYDGTWDALDGLSLPDGLHLCTNYVGRAGIPGRIRRARALAERLAGDQDGAANDSANRRAVANK